MNRLFISTQDEIAGFKIVKTHGLVYGNIVRSNNIIRNFFAAIRSVFGGEIPEYTRIVQDSRDQAIERMRLHAASIGANAVVGMRLITSELMQSCTEIVAYGTAVYIDDLYNEVKKTTDHPETVYLKPQ